MRDLPNISLGNRVRIMQTTEMVQKELANLHGRVTAIAGRSASIQFDDDKTATRQIPLDSLMRE